jgi:5-hydroxytryptamine receptor 1
MLSLLQVTQHWFMGAEVCDMWIAMDVLCCTASIYGLVAISIDRYWAVTNIDYMRKRTTRRMCIMIIIVWMAALSISIPSILLFKDDNDPDHTGICMISQDLFYTIFSTVGAFYLPTVILLIIYAKIFTVARQRILRKKFSEKRKNLEVQLNRRLSPQFNNAPEMTLLTVPHHGYTAASRSDISETPLDDSASNCDKNYPTIEQIYFTSVAGVNNTRDEIMKAKKEKEKLKRKRERKVARTLTIITGSFIICWLPFFIIAISAPFIRSKVNIPRLVESITLWLGYFNSLLNPIIYTMFNVEFRKAFKDLLCRRCLRKDMKRTLDLWI